MTVYKVFRNQFSKHFFLTEAFFFKEEFELVKIVSLMNKFSADSKLEVSIDLFGVGSLLSFISLSEIFLS